MQTVSQAATATRTITVFSSQGKNNNPIEFSGTYWKELKDQLKKNGYNIDDMTAIESLQQHELTVPDAIIPTEDFYLHLFPVETKSGAAKVALPSKKDAQAAVKAAIEEGGEDAKAFFKGYTKLSVEELVDLQKKWGRKAASKKATKPAAKKATAAPKKAAAKKATTSSKKTTAKAAVAEAVEAEVPAKKARTEQEVQAEYGTLRNQLSRQHSGKHFRVRG